MMHVQREFPPATRFTVPGNPAPRVIRLGDTSPTGLLAFDDERFVDIGPFWPFAQQVVELAGPEVMREIWGQRQGDTVADALADQTPLNEENVNPKGNLQ